MIDLFGVDDDKQDSVMKAPQTPTVGGNANFHTLVKHQTWMNDDDINDKEYFTPCETTARCSITVRCSFLPFTCNVSSDVDLETLTAAYVFTKVKEQDNSFEPDKFDLGFYSGETKTLAIFNPSALLSQHGFTDPTTMTLAIARKPC